jgi:acyl-[acyl-carrier-protein]-phospholipid O-acyltransferase/long-chain-fatty-acid--[acyl-carrier-protein] ligase
MILLIILLTVALLVYASFILWPNRSLWFLLEYANKQHYRIHFDGVNHRLDRPVTFIADKPSIKMASLLRRVTSLPVYWVTKTQVESAIQRHFLEKADIFLISHSKQIPPERRGIVIISASNHAEISILQEPLGLLYLCGEAAPSSTKMRWIPRDLQLSAMRYVRTKDGALVPALQRLAVLSWERYVDKLPSIVESWLDQAKAQGNRLSVADSTGAKLTHHRLITAVLGFRDRLFTLVSEDSRVGVCLPSSVGGIITLLALLCLGKTLVNLNYTASVPALKAAIAEAGLKHVISSKRFIENLAKKGFSVDGVFDEVEMLYLEDIRKTISQKELFKKYLMVKFLPVAALKAILVNPISSNKVAAILFSSGSEGRPKGVELTHRNIVGNARQAGEALEARADDVILSILPIFHAFGLTVTTLLPLIEGVTAVCHPDPTDTGSIGELTQQFKATILCGTSTFFRLYAKARNVTPEMFNTLRIIVAGAERLAPEVRVLFEEKFKKVIFEGYGTTELSPVSHSNRPDTDTNIRQKMGTVGHPLPGIMARIIDPETEKELPIGESGLIVVGGVNVMKGYLNAPEKTSEVLLYEHGIRWYKTGDKGRLDPQGFLTILDRYSRFAKLGGEMISLGAIENQINIAVNHEDVEVLAVAVPDLKKGEKIILLCTGPYSTDEIENIVKTSELPNLMRPSEYLLVEAIPKLGTGKSDFSAAKKLVLERLAGQN